MSDAHKPGRVDEEARIKLANGWITEEKYVHSLVTLRLSDTYLESTHSRITLLFCITMLLYRELYMGRLHRMDLSDPAIQRKVDDNRIILS